MSLRHLTPSDVEHYMLSIHPDSVPPELVADGVVLLAPLRITPSDGETLLLSVLAQARRACAAIPWARVPVNRPATWIMDTLRTDRGWHPAEHWTPDNLRVFIDQTIERHCGGKE